MSPVLQGKVSMRKVLYVETEDKEFYAFKLKKKENKTKIYGEEYTKFLTDYDMTKGDQIRIYLNKPLMLPLDKNGFMKDRVEEDYVFEDEVQAFVMSDGMEPTASEIASINKYAKNHGIGLGVVFVHIITATDVKKNALHIPKLLSSVPDIPKTGNVLLVYGLHEGINMDATYFKSVDGRIRFKNVWKEFDEKNHVKEGNADLFMFHSTPAGLEITYDPIRF